MNKNTIIGFLLIGVIMFGFTWYQSRQYQEQMEVQAQLDSIARVEQMAAMAMDSVKKAQGTVAETDVKVSSIPAYKDSLLTSARMAEASMYRLANDRIEIEFTSRGAQPYSVKLNDYKSYDSTDLYLIRPDMSRYDIKLYAGENINTKDFNFEVVEHSDRKSVV